MAVPALDVRGLRLVRALIAEAAARQTADVAGHLDVFHDLIGRVLLIEEILNGIGAFFDQIVLIQHIFVAHRFGVEVLELVRNGRIVNLIDIAVFNRVIAAGDVDFDRVAIARGRAGARLRIHALKRTADPGKHAVFNRQAVSVHRANAVRAAVAYEEVVDQHVVALHGHHMALFGHFDGIKARAGIALVGIEIDVLIVQRVIHLKIARHLIEPALKAVDAHDHLIAPFFAVIEHDQSHVVGLDERVLPDVLHIRLRPF